MKWRLLLALTVAMALVLGVMATPATADDAKAELWLDWMANNLIGFDGPGDPTPESWDMPSIQGDWVVWQKTADAALNWNIEAYNIKTRQTRSVCTAVGAQIFPQIYGNWVVWTDARDGANLEIYAYNLATNVERRITNTPGVQEVWADISGTKIVYFSIAGDVWVYDLANGSTKLLPLGAGAQLWPRISGDRVVYQEANEIYVIDLRTNAITRLTNDAVADGFPDIDGTLVAWQRQGASVDIWTQDLAGGGPSLAFTNGGNDVGPRVSNNLVLFAFDDGSFPYEVGVYDRSSGAVLPLTSDGPHMNPTFTFGAIDGVNLVYTSDYGSGAHGGDITLGRLVGPVFSASPSTTKPAYAGKVVLKGSLVDNGLRLGGVPLTVQRSTNGGHTWSNVGSPSTNSNGDFSFTTPANYSKTLYRVRFAPTLFFGPAYPNQLSATSQVMTVIPKASVGKPTGYPSTGKKNKSYSVYGSLKPRQATTAASSKVVAIKCYRKQSGKYKLRKTVYARVYNYSTYSRYRASVKLPYTGKWRLRAYFKGSSINSAKYSSYRYVTVK